MAVSTVQQSTFTDNFFSTKLWWIATQNMFGEENIDGLGIYLYKVKLEIGRVVINRQNFVLYL